MNQTFQNAGILVQQFTPDGQIHRVGTIAYPRGNAGWYTGTEINGEIYVTCGNWVTDETHKYCSKDGTSPEVETNWKMLAKLAQQEQDKKNSEAKAKAQTFLPTLQKATEHPYLTKKNIKPYGALEHGKDLIIPILNSNEIVGYQSIKPDGEKRFLFGAVMKGSYHIIKGVGETIYACEGWATGCTIHEATGKTVIICFNAGNLKRVCDNLPDNLHIIVAADNDTPTDKYPNVGGCGVYHANKTGETVKFPITIGDFNDIGIDETKRILEPLVGIYTPEKLENNQVLFPTDQVYEGAPDVYKRVYDEWIDSVTEPIAGFAFATIESAMQVLCGQKVLTPGHARTVVTYSLCGSHSGAGKDLSSKNPLRKLREQLINAGDPLTRIIFDKLTTGIGNITGDTAFLNQAGETNGSFLWLTTEASEPLRQLSSNSSMANQGSSLATALNDSYDGHEVTGKRKAGGAVAAVNYPNIPVCWLTQLKELKRQLTQELLEIGTLGRFDYILDYNPEKAIRSSFEGGLVVGADATQEEIVKASKGFSDHTIAMLLNQVGHIFEGQVAWRKDAYRYIMDYDIGLKEKYDSTDGIGKFLCRTSMSVEKRLTAWVAMDSRNVIELSDVKAIMPWFEYQVAMREQVYMREIKKDSDLLRAVKDTIEKIFLHGKGIVTSKSKNKAKEYAKLIKQGIVSRADFHAKFDQLYSDDFPKYLERSAMTRELEQYVKEGDICMGQQPGGFRATTQFVWIPED